LDKDYELKRAMLEHGLNRWRDQTPFSDNWFYRGGPDNCSMCYRQNERTVVDHCHVTGWVRGSLCRTCNQQEGTSKDPIWWAWRLKAPYLQPGDRLPYIAGWGHAIFSFGDYLERYGFDTQHEFAHTPMIDILTIEEISGFHKLPRRWSAEKSDPDRTLLKIIKEEAEIYQ